MFPSGNHIVAAVTVVVVLASLTATTAVAVQDLRTIEVNQTASGTIDTADPYDADFGGYYEPVEFQGAAGQLVTVTMRAGNGTTLYLLDPSGDVVASDGGNDRGAELRRKLQSTGEYTVVAASDDPEDTFAYELTVAVPAVPHLHSTGNDHVYGTLESDNSTITSLQDASESLTADGVGQRSACTQKTSIPTVC